MKFLVSGILAILAVSLSSALEPKLLSPAKGIWAEPIELSQTNAGEEVTMTVNLNPSISLSEGYLEVHFPKDGFTAYTTGKTNNVHAWDDTNDIATIKASFTAGQDQSERLTVTLPSTAGIYGPFKLIIREAENGEIKAANFVFATIAVTSSVTAQGLTVGPTTGSVAIKSSQKLTFDFTLNHDVWKNDVMVLTVDSSKTDPSMNWDLSLTGCESKNLTDGTTNNLEALDGTRTLNCMANSDNTGIYIYGIGKDIPSGKQIIIEVSSFTAPAAAIPGSDYTGWSLKIWRFGTNNLIGQYDASSGLGLTLTPGSISVSSWGATNTFTGNEALLDAMTVYTTVKFATSNLIPKSGQVVVSFTGSSIGTDKEFAGVKTSSGKDVSISTISSDDVTIDAGEDIPADTFELTVVTTLGSGTTNNIDSIISKDSSSNEIDKVTDASTFQLTGSTTDTVLSGEFVFKAKESPDGGTSAPKLTTVAGDILYSDPYYGVIEFVIPDIVAYSPGWKITISCPLSTSGVEFGKIFANTEASSNPTTLEVLGSYSTKPTPVASSDTITLEDADDPFPGGGTITIKTNAAGGLSLPLVATGGSFFYECRIRADTDTSDATTPDKIAATQFKVTAATSFGTIGVGEFCTSQASANSQMGYVPIWIQIANPTKELDDTFVLEIDLTLAESGTTLGLGIEDANADSTVVPIYSSTSKGTAVLTHGSTPSLKIQQFGTVATDATLDILVPKYFAVTKTTTTVYYKLDGQKNVVYKAEDVVAFSDDNGNGSYDSGEGEGFYDLATQPSQTMNPGETNSIEIEPEGHNSQNLYIFVAFKGWDVSQASIPGAAANINLPLKETMTGPLTF